MEDKSNPVPNPTEQRSTQLQDTIQVTIQALGEIDSPSLQWSENRALKKDWINRLKERLTADFEEAGRGVDSIEVPTYTDASFAFQPNRGFFAAFMMNLGSPITYANINGYLSDPEVAVVTEDRIEEPRQAAVARVIDSAGRLIYLVTKTKIDGLQILLEGSAITDPNKTDRTVKPILVISNKS